MTTVASHNILRSLGRAEARVALHAVLDHEPDLVGLQEWGPKRIGLLRETGPVGLLPWGPGFRARGEVGYHWSTALLGGCAIGVRADRYDVVGTHSVLLDWPGFADKPGRPLRLEPARIAALGVYRDRRTGSEVALVDYHLAPGVEVGGGYREDRPRLVLRHQEEVRRISAIVDAQQRLGRTVFAVGDANYHGLKLDSLTSAWTGYEQLPGTLVDGRTIDDVFALTAPTEVEVVSTPSDHKAVIARFDEP